MPQSNSTFEPNANMLAVLDLARQNNFQSAGSHYCVEADLSRDIFYKWCRDSSYVTWWEDHAERHAKMKLAKVLNALADGATQKVSRQESKLQAPLIKLFLERFDPKYNSKQEVGVTIEGIPDFLKILHGESDETDGPPA